MTKAPERIWAHTEYDEDGGAFIEFLSDEPWPGEDVGVEYTRTDLSNALIGAAYEEAAAEALKAMSGYCHPLGKGDRYALGVQAGAVKARDRIRALTTADARAALERVAKAAKGETGPERIVEMQASDFISEVIEQLQKLSAEIRIGPDGEGQDFQNTLDACADDLETALESVEHPRWYRMDDPENPPPKDGRLILVATKAASTWAGMWVAYSRDGCWQVTVERHVHPTHWTPLLAPPEDEG